MGGEETREGIRDKRGIRERRRGEERREQERVGDRRRREGKRGRRREEKRERGRRRAWRELYQRLGLRQRQREVAPCSSGLAGDVGSGREKARARSSLASWLPTHASSASLSSTFSFSLLATH